MKCPICGNHTGATSIMNIFHAYCCDEHGSWGEENRRTKEITYTLYYYRIKVKNRKFLINHNLRTDMVEIARGLKYSETTICTISFEDYTNKYKDNPKAFLQLVETAEVFV